MDQPTPERWLTITEASKAIGISRRTLYNWIAAGKVTTQCTAGGSMRVLESSLWRSGSRVEAFSQPSPLQ